jgi:hypothetical protein
MRRSVVILVIPFIAMCAVALPERRPPLVARVVVEADGPTQMLGAAVFGIHTSVYDDAMQRPHIPELLRNIGIGTLRYPGGGYADIYHWSTNTLNGWKATDVKGRLANGTDFGNFAKLLDRVGGEAIITVNYGTNLRGTGPGEPAEAAAWVAYAGASPDDPHLIGMDSSGIDWRTSGYWATMRASSPVDPDDGYNFLRIAHPQPLHIRYWEIGNEVFGNGYYGGNGYEQDRHAPYNRRLRDDLQTRPGAAELSPAAYGRGMVEFARAMKAVNPHISIGAVLNTPPMDYGWGPDWDREVLLACSQKINFVSVHWYAGDFSRFGSSEAQDATLLEAPANEVPRMTAELQNLFDRYAGARNLQFAVTEINARPGARNATPLGLFAADAYAGLAERGAINIDWLELHHPSFLKHRDNSPGPAYFGIQMVHLLLDVGDGFVPARSSINSLSTHAARRADGSIAVMLINKDPVREASVEVTIEEFTPASSGTRFDWGPSAPPTGYRVRQLQIANLGSHFNIKVPAYTVTDVVLLPEADSGQPR